MVWMRHQTMATPPMNARGETAISAHSSVCRPCQPDGTEEVTTLRKKNSNSHGARPVHLIITMIKWIWTSRLLIKNSLTPPCPPVPPVSVWALGRSTLPRHKWPGTSQLGERGGPHPGSQCPPRVSTQEGTTLSAHGSNAKSMAPTSARVVSLVLFF